MAELNPKLILYICKQTLIAMMHIYPFTVVLAVPTNLWNVCKYLEFAITLTKIMQTVSIKVFYHTQFYIFNAYSYIVLYFHLASS